MMLANWTTVRDKPVPLFGHIIPIPSRPVFAISPYGSVLSGEATHTNLVFVWFKILVW